MSPNSAVQIVEKVGGKYKLNTDALKRILQQNSVMNKKVAILTVAGAFRKGKSFLLSNIVRYLQCKRRSNWMEPTALVTGFTWARSKNPVTDGILMWPESFFAEDANGEEYAILLMDTEGAFDHKSSIGQCATVFALGALLSSVLVYNVMQDVQEDTLNHLQFFAKYGSFALDEKDSKSPFQSLLFLIRDWQNDDEFGFEAGRKLLEDKFQTHANSDSSMQTLRKDIKRSFVDMKCMLLPRPGDEVCCGSEGKITVADMNEDFKEQLDELVRGVFNNLMRPKEIGGKSIIGAEFLSFFETYATLFESGKVPKPMSIFEATAEATHQSALNICLDNYTKTMKTHFSQLSERQFFEEAKLERVHQDATAASVKIFDDTRKMGHLPQFLISLKQKIQEQFKEVFLKDNQARISIEKAREEKEEEEKRRVEQEKKTNEEHARLERDNEALRIQVEKERKEKEESDRRRLELERKEKERRDNEDAQQFFIPSKREQDLFMWKMIDIAAVEIAKNGGKSQVQRARECYGDSITEQQLSQAVRYDEFFQSRGNELLSSQRDCLGVSGSMMQLNNSLPCYDDRFDNGSFNFGSSYSNASRCGTPSGRPRGRPPGTVDDRLSQGIMPKEGTRDWNRVQASLSSSSTPRTGTPSGRPLGRPPGNSSSFGSSNSNASRAGTPSGRPPGRPRGSVMERYSQGIMPKEGTRDYDRLKRDGFL